MKKPKPYEPRVIRLTSDEAKNGWTEQKLLDWMRRNHGTSFELCAELYTRAKDYERQARAAVAKFDEDLTVAENQECFAELEREASEAEADAAFAAAKYTAAAA